MNLIESKPGLPNVPADASPLAAWAKLLVTRATKLFVDVALRANGAYPKDGSEGLSAYTVATRPPAASAPGAIIYVSDGAAGAKFQGSDGSAWVNLG